MRRLVALLTLLALGAAVPAAAGKTRLHIRGAGYGHGVGMSQYGAYGFARHDRNYRFILGHYYTGTEIGRAPARDVRVLLQSPRGEASFTGAHRAGDRELDPDHTYKVARASGGEVELRSAEGRKLETYSAPLRVTGPGPLTLRGAAGNGVRNGRYRGALEFRPGLFGGVNAINALSLDDYVRGVVAAEMPSSWPAEALKAQSVAARTYAITSNVGGTGYDQYPDTRSQVYRGVTAETASTDAAIAATSDQVVTYGGRPVTTFFFSTSGGRTENKELSFVGSQPNPWLRSVEDPFDDLSPKHRWRLPSLTLAQAQRKLGNLVKGRFRSIRVVRRGRSPRIVYADVVGTRGRTRTTGAVLRARLDLFDTWAHFTRVSSKRSARGSAVAGRTGGQPVDPSQTAPYAQTSDTRRGRTLVGEVEPGRAGARLVVEQRRGQRWVRVGTTRLRSDGTYGAVVRSAGVFRVRYGQLPGPAVRLR